VTDEKPENEIEKDDDSGEHEQPETETTEDEAEEGPRPYIRYTASARRGSIWNSPIGLVVVGVLVSKGMDLAYRAFIEREKTKRAEIQPPQTQKQK